MRVMFIGMLARLPGMASAQETSVSPAAKLAANNMSHESAICSVYYQITAQCVANRDAVDPLLPKVQKVADTLTQQSYTFGKLAGVVDEAMLARFQLAAQEQRTMIHGDCVNMSILNLKYGEYCKTLAENPTAAFEAFMDQASKEQAQ